MSPSPDPDRRPLAVAHRGWHKVHIENTMEAFRAAYAVGCDMVEFDVQLSRDGVPFIFHDDDGRRLAGKREAVYDLDWKDLKDWVMPPTKGASKGESASGYRLPTLEQFLQEFGSKAFYLELKVPKARQKDEAYWGTLGEKCAAMVQSFSPRPESFLASFHGPILSHLGHIGAYPRLVGIFESLERFRQALDTGAPAIERYSLSWDVYQGYRTSIPESGSFNPRTSHPTVDKILLWNIFREKDMSAAARDGIYGLVADDVETMVRICRQL